MGEHEQAAGWVVVVGSVNIDLTVRGPRLPRSGETVMGGTFSMQGGGKSANQACAAARFGATTIFVGAVGDDELGAQAMAAFEADGVDATHVVRLPGIATGVAVIAVGPGGENQIAVASGANAALGAEHVTAELARLDPPAGSICLLGFEVSDEVVLAAARWAAHRGLRIVLDPAPARPLPGELLALAPILKPNQSEAAALTHETSPESAAAALIARTNAPVVISLGAEGALLMEPGHAGPEHIPAPAVESVDTTGAGDALGGILAAGLAARGPIRQALTWAVTGAALSTLEPGARGGLPTREDIARALGTISA